MSVITDQSALDELSQRHVWAGPSYNAYPACDRFVDAFSVEDYRRAFAMRRSNPAAMRLALSLYVHIPFCESLCFFCSSDNIITKNRARAQSYLQYLTKEIELIAGEVRLARTVSQVHVSGGTPTFLTDDQLRHLMDVLRRNFTFAAGSDCSIDIDPRTVDSTRLDALLDMGFNRLNFGICDFNRSVQQAVHRPQSSSQSLALLQAAKDRGFKSVGVDLVCGLPQQTVETFDETLRQLLAARPDRLVLKAYAHKPERFRSHRQIDGEQISDDVDRKLIRTKAMSVLLESGYEYVGMDYFALPNDSMAKARRQGRLQRSVQGYTNQAECDLIGFGVSAIGRIGATYSQNARTLDLYMDRLDQGQLPVARGLHLTRDDLVRRAVIMALICQGEVFFESIEAAHLIDFRKHFAAELRAMEAFCDQGLVVVSDSAISLTPNGLLLAPEVAMVFDHYRQADLARALFSELI